MKAIVKLFSVGFSLLVLNASAQNVVGNTDNSKFRQLGQELPTPNTYRTASGAPGEGYWQQRADYNIEVKLDEKNFSVTGKETIVYHNNSPHSLKYLWLQLDQNIFLKSSIASTANGFNASELVSVSTFDQIQSLIGDNWEGGYTLTKVATLGDKPLHYTISGTMLRIDLPSDLAPKATFSFRIEWFNKINEVAKHGGRGGYEAFPADGNSIFEMAQWFPRMAVYDDAVGWQHKQYIGRGEFALEFGDYDVAITVPSDHIVAATGVLQNISSVLNSKWQSRLADANKTGKLTLVINQAEAVEAEKTKSATTKTWKFKAENVRDFAWASSRKFIWDVLPTKVEGKNVLSMSYYPKEGNPLWGRYSTKAVAQTLKTYSKYSVAYPYPVAISVHGPIGGMEYPMICFNGFRPESDGTYTERLKNGLIGVVIHEVGHNFFPMIVSSDERQWTWMDEGLNTYLQYLTEKEWDRNFPSSRGEAKNIAFYMASDKTLQVPIMVNSESALQFGNNAYGKPATALNVLRETVVGRELFDFAFKQYANRWAYKHPNPADFFRSIEDATGVDLDWFWRGWFYTTDHVDIAITNVKVIKSDMSDPSIEKALQKQNADNAVKTISQQRDAISIEKTAFESDTSLKDFYSTYNPYKVTSTDAKRFNQMKSNIPEDQMALLSSPKYLNMVSFENIGGLVMPLIVQLKFDGGKDSLVRIPAEVWRYNNKTVTKVFVTSKPVVSFQLDPYLETADADVSNNRYISTGSELKVGNTGQDRFSGGKKPLNPMQIQKLEDTK